MRTPASHLKLRLFDRDLTQPRPVLQPSLGLDIALPSLKLPTGAGGIDAAKADADDPAAINLRGSYLGHGSAGLGEATLPGSSAVQNHFGLRLFCPRPVGQQKALLGSLRRACLCMPTARRGRTGERQAID